MIKKDIVDAEKAITDDNIVAIVKCFATLKENK